MSILVDHTTRVLVHGVTTRRGRSLAEHMVVSKVQVVAGVSGGHGGEWVAGLPVFDSSLEAVAATDANAAVLCIAPHEVQEAVLESVDAGIPLLICTTSSVPIWDMVRLSSFLRDKSVRLIGPNSAGVFTPPQGLIGAIAPEILCPGQVGVVSRSGSLTYEMTLLLTEAGFGQSTVVCVGSAMILGMGFVNVLAMFEDDPLTQQVVIVGEIGSKEEEQAAEYVRDYMTKPVVAFVAGQTSPPGRRMGHTGAIIEGYVDTAQIKMSALRQAGVLVAESMSQVPDLLERSLV